MLFGGGACAPAPGRSPGARVPAGREAARWGRISARPGADQDRAARVPQLVDEALPGAPGGTWMVSSSEESSSA